MIAFGDIFAGGVRGSMDEEGRITVTVDKTANIHRTFVKRKKKKKRKAPPILLPLTFHLTT